MSDLFSQKAQEWDKNEMIRHLSAGVSASMLDKINFTDNMRCLDFGAGTGLVSSSIAPYVQHILAVDISSSMLDKLMAKPELEGKVEALCQNIIDEPLDRTFDIIISAMALHHVDDTRLLLERFHQHLNPSGRIALADLDKEDGTFHPEDVEGVFHHGFDRGELRQLLEDSGFTDVSFSTAHTVQRDDKDFPIFLVTAQKP